MGRKDKYLVRFPEELVIGQKTRDYTNIARSNTQMITIHRNTNGIPGKTAIAVACIHRGDPRIHIHVLKEYEDLANALANSIETASGKKLVRPNVIITAKLPSASMSVEEAKRFYPGALTDTRRKLTRLWHSAKNFRGGG
jgi:hypothetical protein